MSMRFILLTHSRELTKKSATGPLIKQTLPEQCDVIEWSRTFADERLTKHLDVSRTLLIYPEANTNNKAINNQDNLALFDSFIILDGTWQEARKIYNRSPYLHQLTHYALEVDYSSSYQLRRNQKNTGLCTAEVAIELLRQKGQLSQAKELEAAYQDFNLGTDTLNKDKND